MSYFAPADDFRLSQDARIDGATIYAQGLHVNNPAQWTGELEWAVFSSGPDDRPDALLLHGFAQNIVREATTSTLHASVTFDFGTSFHASHGTRYFLAIHALGVSPGAHIAIRWSTAARDPHAFGAPSTAIRFVESTSLFDVPVLVDFASMDPPVTWQNYFRGYTADLGFELHGEVVPEPSTALLLSSGLVLLAIRRSRGR